MLKRVLKYFLIFVLIILLFSVIGLLVGDYIYQTYRFPKNCFIENVDVSFLTKREAIQKLKKIPVDEACQSNITLRFEDKTFEFRPSEIGVYIQPVNSVNRAFLKAYEQSYIKTVIDRTKDIKKILPLFLGVDEEKCSSVLENISLEIDIPSKDAEFYLAENGAYTIKKEKIGRFLNIQKTLSLIKYNLMESKKDINLIVEQSLPKVYSEDLKKFPPKWVISKFTTRYGGHDDPGRIHNIKTASKKLDNKIIASGEVFSLLKAIGKTTKDEGFKEAMVIINGELVEEYGGGVCQIATTLYNAALLANLEIVERRNHAIYFSIYPLGLDAMVYAGEADLKIKNNKQYPILIKTYATEKNLTFKLYGQKQNEEVILSKPEINLYGSSSFSTLESFLFNKPFSTKIIKNVKLNGKIVSSEVIRSYYRLQSD